MSAGAGAYFAAAAAAAEGEAAAAAAAAEGEAAEPPRRHARGGALALTRKAWFITVLAANRSTLKFSV
jgi:hypothetical protein